MKTLIKQKRSINADDNLVVILNKKSDLDFISLSREEKIYLTKKLKQKQEIIYINQYQRWLQFVYIKDLRDKNKLLENYRLSGNKLLEKCGSASSLLIIDTINDKEAIIALAEGISLGNYEYNTHKSLNKEVSLKTIYLYKNDFKDEINELQQLVDSVYLCRDLVNSPFSHLKASDLAKAAQEAGKVSGFKTEVLTKKKIESLKMGGLLAVNQGSLDGPTFTIMEYKSKTAKNEKPIVLVGKGIVYDTGGLSLKPTTNSMDMMKVDMGGGACVIGAMYAIAANKLNVHVVGLVPATDNRPSGNAYAPGDVVKMHSGATVEVLNTDAEGRMILADALSFAKKYNPEIVIDLATLTGAAARCIGHFGIVSMHQKAKQYHKKLRDSGNKVHERLAELPFWDDYGSLIKSEVADIKNLGGGFGGAITAGKFLAHFTDYPWIHLDIAGPTFVKEKYGYRGKGATGIGVRLLYNFVKNY